MKLNKYSWLAVLPMFFTACQEDTLVKEQQQNDGIYSLNCTIGQETTNSRAQIVLGNTEVEQEFFKWNAGDSFTLYQNDNKKLKPVTFTISSDYSNDALSSSANFYASEAIPAGTYKAVYPTTVTVNADDEYERVALEQQKNLDFGSGTIEEVWRNYFSKNMLMRAEVVLTENGAESVNFYHECALARITYKNDSGIDQPIGGVSLGGNQQFGHIKTLNVIGGWDSGASSNDYPIFINNLTVNNGETFDFYVLFFPCGFANGEMHLNMNTSGNWMSPLTLPLSTIAEANNGATSFIGGKRYWFNVTQTPEGLAWTKDLSNSGDEGSQTTIEEVAQNGGTFIVNQDTRLTTPLIVEGNMTLKLEGGWLGGTYGEGNYADPDNLKTLIAVKPGATLIIEGSNQLNTGHNLEQLSCIRLLGGSANASKVVINNGLIIGTHHAIVVDEDCQKGEVEINGGSLSCDWEKEYNGSAILNKGNALINIKGGHVSSCGSAVEMWNGTFTMSNGTLESSYEGTKTGIHSNNPAANRIVGSALAFYTTQGKTVTATISSGTLKGISSVYEVTVGVNLSIEGGTFDGAVISNNCSKFISGGQFKVQPNPNYLASGKTTSMNGDYYEIVGGESQVLEEYRATNVLGFEQFKEALNKKAKKTYIELGDAMAIEEPIVIEEGREVEINLNGKYMVLINEFFQSYTPDAVFVNSGDLKITNGTIHGHQIENSTEFENSYLFKSQNGLLRFEGVRIYPHDIMNGIYIKDGYMELHNSSQLEAMKYALYIEANTKCGVDFYQSKITGSVYWALNNSKYSEGCILSVGPNSEVNSNLTIGGTYGTKATGYILRREITSVIGTKFTGWENAEIVGSGEEPGENEGGGNKPQGGNTHGSGFGFTEL